MTRAFWAVLVLLAFSTFTVARANVITDWDETAVSTVQPSALGSQANVAMAMVHIAMFDAVNSINPHYKSYKVQLTAPPGTSEDAAAAAAAAKVLIALVPAATSKVQATLTSYLAAMPDGDAKTNGVKLGEDVAAKVIELRVKDGSAALEAYRPRTAPGVYVPTQPTLASSMPGVTPFAMTSASEFRPPPPIALTSAQWAKDYNEIAAVGEKNSTTRTPRQTEDARLWLTTGPMASHPLERQIAQLKKMSVVDSARFMALLSITEADALIAVFDAKYHYEFWRPVTAIRNGDRDGNPATARVATWQPIDATPMHPEYPCAHCIVSSSVSKVIELVTGTVEIPEVAVTTPTAPGVTHHFTNLNAYTTEVANARIYAGFHYRFSTVAGQEMGRKIGANTVNTVMQPLKLASK